MGMGPEQGSKGQFRYHREGPFVHSLDEPLLYKKLSYLGVVWGSDVSKQKADLEGGRVARRQFHHPGNPHYTPHADSVGQEEFDSQDRVELKWIVAVHPDAVQWKVRVVDRAPAIADGGEDRREVQTAKALAGVPVTHVAHG